MNKFAFALGIVFLFTAAAAENYTQAFTVNGWLKVTRFADTGDGSGCTSVTDSCSATGALLPYSMGRTSGAFTSITLTFENAGGSDRQEVQLTEDLSQVPDGAKLAFEPQPAYSDGRSATWTAAVMKAGEKKTVRYTYTAKSSADDIARIQNPEVKAKVTSVTLTAPPSAKVGERVLISAKTPEGAPLPGAKVIITYPDGTIQQAKTDSKGSAAFTAGKEGFYTYSVEGYSLTRLASTEATIAEIPAAAAAAVAPDSGIFSALSGLLPALAAIFVIAVVALIVYNFFTSRRDEEYYTPAAAGQQPAGGNPAAQRPVPEPPQAPHSYPGAQGATYSQQYTFGSQKKAEDAPKPSPVASQPQAGEGKYPESRAQAPVITSPYMMNRQVEKYSESTSSDEDVERELASLERKAREEGEGATHEQEIENAISELEAIRQKLRERKDQMDSLESRMSGPAKKKEEDSEADIDSDEPDEPTASRRAPARKAAPAPRVLPPKGRKLKFATHGVRRK